MRPAAIGILLIVALLIGGSSLHGVGSTTIVQVLALAVLPALFDWSRPGGGYWRAVDILLAGGVVLMVLQLLPLGGLLPIHSLADSALSLPMPLALTVEWDRTAAALLFVVPPVVLFLVLGRFSENDFNRLLPSIYLGLLFNIVFALAQFAASSGVKISPEYLPYAAAAGFFANQNHFATLMFIGIPLVIYQFVVIRRPILSLPAVGLIILASFATRSVAGAYLSLGCALFSYALIARMATRWRIVLILLAIGGMIVLSFNPGNVLEFRQDDPLDRPSIWHNTLAGVAAYWPLGAGFGTFDLVYQQFETAADIRANFINHAHDEYLELLLEGGLAVALMLFVYLALVGLAMWRLPRSPLRWAAFCGIAFVLVHSLVDYPLRTISLALVFAVLNAMVFSRQLRPAQPKSA